MVVYYIKRFLDNYLFYLKYLFHPAFCPCIYSSYLDLVRGTIYSDEHVLRNQTCACSKTCERWSSALNDYRANQSGICRDSAPLRNRTKFTKFMFM